MWMTTVRPEVQVPLPKECRESAMYPGNRNLHTLTGREGEIECGPNVVRETDKEQQ